jgi:RNA polymerase sigma-70 factor (sigma-E family)
LKGKMGEAPRTFDECFEPLVAVAYRVAFRILGNRAEAEDVAQEALARAYARWASVENHAEPWVARVAANQALKHWRRSQRTAPRQRTGANDDDGLALTRLHLREALRRLPRRQREVLVLRYLADLSEDAVAAHLGCATGTVKQHAHRGLSKLRVILADEHSEVNIVPAP